MTKQVRPNFIGFTDTGQPLVLPDGGCQHWMSTGTQILGGKQCWYCKYADFRKTTQVELQQSICRCPYNRAVILQGMENEYLGKEEI